jgi:hypothetical protein
MNASVSESTEDVAATRQRRRDDGDERRELESKGVRMRAGE